MKGTQSDVTVFHTSDMARTMWTLEHISSQNRRSLFPLFALVWRSVVTVRQEVDRQLSNETTWTKTHLHTPLMSLWRSLKLACVAKTRLSRHLSYLCVCVCVRCVFLAACCFGFCSDVMRQHHRTDNMTVTVWQWFCLLSHYWSQTHEYGRDRR